MKNFNTPPAEHFTRVPNWLVAEPALEPREFRLLLYFWSTHPLFQPAYADIITATGMARQTVTDTIRALQALKIIEVREGPYGKHLYCVTPRETWDLGARAARRAKGAKVRRKPRPFSSEMAEIQTAGIPR